MKIKDLIQGLGDVKLADFDPFHKDSSKGKSSSEDDDDVFGDKESRNLDAEFKARLERAKQGAHRLKDVFAAPIQMVADFIPPVYPKADEEKAFIIKALGDSFVFSHLGSKERNTLIDAFEPVEAFEGEMIIKQGDIGDYFYVLQKGKVQYVVNGQAVGEASAGDTFGEIALLHDCPRAASCLALSSCRLFRVGQTTFRRILMSYAMKNDDETKKLLTKVEFFKDLDDRALAKVASALSVVTFKKGEVIARKGDEGKTFYIIQKGKIGATDIILGGTKYDDLVLGPGEHWGEGAIIKDIPIVANISALEDSTVLVMNKENFQKTIGDFRALFQLGWDRKKLQAIPLANGQKLTTQETDMLASLVVNETYHKGHIFYQEGTSADPYLFLIRSGSVDITTSFMGIEFLTGIKANNGETKSIGAEGFFGEDMLDPEKKGAGASKVHPRYTVVAAEDCVVGVLSLKTITEVIASAKGSGLTLSDLDKHKLLGAGTFGKVFLVTKKGTKDAYALKIQYKKQLVEYGQAAGVIRERDVMAKLDHPFIIKLVTSYQDEKHVYMLMKLYLGGELRSVMQNRRRNYLPEWAARFYGATVLEGLGYMHRRHIIYRDLKPENVLLDSEGYTVIVDLGFGKYRFCLTVPVSVHVLASYVIIVWCGILTLTLLPT
jgi:CRP-like cAMP-binding protein